MRLRGEFEMHVDGQVEFYKRMLIIFLGMLEVSGETRHSRRTRDGRTPFCRQEQMATWFGVTHPEISRWYDYWLRQDWRRMLSQRTGEVLTLEVQQRIVDTWAKFPWWGTERLWNHLRSHGSRVTLNQVKQVTRESGGSVLRQALSRVYVIDVESFRLVHIFDARTKRTAQRRYDNVLAQRAEFVAQTPKADSIFFFLERHWPTPVDAIESRTTPTTNNAAEQVIRIFTQHYKTFCGSENIDSARLYLGVFEKVYRFTPFSNDAHPRIRGKCPLELAGYQVQKLPLLQLFRRLALQ